MARCDFDTNVQHISFSVLPCDVFRHKAWSASNDKKSIQLNTALVNNGPNKRTKAQRDRKKREEW